MEHKPLLGIFDSGVGGFSVFKEVRKSTSSDIVYYGDCANAPYGNKEEDQIVLHIKQILTMLKERGVTHFVSACNSMSVLTTEKLLQEMGINRAHYVDMVDAVKAVSFEVGSRVLIIGTKATITSHIYQDILQTKCVYFDVFVPRTLAGDIEQGDGDAVTSDIDEILEYAKTMSATHILYACTHYPLVHDLFLEETHAKNLSCIYIDPAQYVAELVRMWDIEGDRRNECVTSKETDVFSHYKEILV
jgi:glutamate racemase